MNKVLFVPCGCTHENDLAALVAEGEYGAELTTVLQESIRKCQKALDGKNGLCAHLSLFHVNKSMNPRTILATRIKALILLDQENKIVYLNLAREFQHLFSIIDSLDMIKGAEQWRSFDLEKYNEWNTKLHDQLAALGYTEDSPLGSYCAELMDILLRDVIFSTPGSIRTQDSQKRFANLMEDIHGLVAMHLEMCQENLIDLEPKGETKKKRKRKTNDKHLSLQAA